MSRIVSIVVKLDNGKYRRLKLERIKAIYTSDAYICAGTKGPGEDDVAGPETDKPDFDSVSGETRSVSLGGEDGNGPPECHLINGVWICH